MKKVLTFIMILALLCTLAPIASATTITDSSTNRVQDYSKALTLETIYWYRTAENRSTDIINDSFTITKQFLSSTRKCYLNFAFSFHNDSADRYVLVQIGSQTYNIPADGKVHSYTATLPAGSVLYVNTVGIVKDCACIISIYSID